MNGTKFLNGLLTQFKIISVHMNDSDKRPSEFKMFDILSKLAEGTAL